jgi:hypothetical protein
MNTIYPDPTEPAGAPFADPNLKLAVLGSLITDGLITLGSPQELAKYVYGHTVDLEKDGYNVLPKCYDYLVSYPLTQELLEKVTSIEFDGGSPVYPYAQYFFEGYGSEFDISDFTGIEQCTNLQEISVIAMVYGADLAPLAALGKLETLSLSGEETNIAALKDIANLKTLKGFFGGLEGEDAETIAALGARGVEIISNS